MTAPDIHRLLIQPLHDTGVPYMVTGAVAAIAYGEPRMTNDVDVVVWLDPNAAGALHGAFPEDAYYVPPVEVIAEEARRPRYGHFNVIHHDTALRADVYVAGDDALHAWALPRRREESIASGAIWFAPIEYVIVRKLEYFLEGGSDRHLRDVAGMVRVSGDEIDQAALRRLIDERGLSDSWERAVSTRSG
jgi:hypothetical protein